MEHDRVIVAGNMFHSEQYSRPNKTDSTAFVTGQGKCLKVKHIVSFKDASDCVKIFIVSYRFSSECAYKTNHVMVARRAEQEILVELSTDVSPCTYMECGGKIFFVRLAQKTLLAS